MSKINYIKCDICGKKIESGFHITHKKLFIFHNRYKFDICDSCISKLNRVSNDIKNEEEIFSHTIKNGRGYEFEDNDDLYTAYLTGVEDASKVLSQYQMKE